jgi:hypothetical protein
VAATAAFGAGITPAANVAAGSLSLTTTSAPSASFVLDGTDQSANLPTALAVVDSTGSGLGWNVTESATQFTATGGKTLNAPTATTTSAVCKSGASCTPATNSITAYPITLTGTAVKIFNAAAASGLGRIDLTSGLGVSVPGNALAGSYTSTVTVSIVSGP